MWKRRFYVKDSCYQYPDPLKEIWESIEEITVLVTETGSAMSCRCLCWKLWGKGTKSGTQHPSIAHLQETYDWLTFHVLADIFDSYAIPQGKAGLWWSTVVMSSSWAQSEVLEQIFFLTTAWETSIPFSVSSMSIVCHKLPMKEKISPLARKKILFTLTSSLPCE